MQYINEVLGQLFVWLADGIVLVLDPLLGSNVIDKINAALGYVVGWNQVLPLASLFSIAAATFTARMTIRLARFFFGFVPTVHG